MVGLMSVNGDDGPLQAGRYRTALTWYCHKLHRRMTKKLKTYSAGKTSCRPIKEIIRTLLQTAF